ncbi:MAG: GspE/PulE family protein [bacterium]|nr:GspE/PulE family protein [bacterium]
MADTRILNALADKNLIEQNAVSEIANKAITDEDIEREVFERGVSEENFLEAKSEALGVPFRYLKGVPVPGDILRFIPLDAAKHYQMIPLGITEGVLEVGMLDPTDIEAREAVQFIATKFNVAFKVFLIARSDFIKILEEYKSLGSEVTQVLGELEDVMVEEGKRYKTTEKKSKEDEETFSEKAPVTRMVAVIIRHATEGNASDIHIEPGRDKLRVRFRVDGVLHTSLLLPVKVHDAIVARVKILTNMQLDEKRKPQDGRFSTRVQGRNIDFRVSTFPTSFGEKVVLRILDPEKGVKDLVALGLMGRNLAVVTEELKRPYGMVLVTGPTGSGKSTTLYTMLQILNKEGLNIVSLEDPIEYNIAGVNQSQVRPEIGYTFATGLRSILRQDPDIIMVGEIRDKETAQLAIHAALTGHLVLSTLHTNNAIGVIPRLIDMGVDPYLIAPTLILAIAQRLVQVLCEDSKREVPIQGKLSESLKQEIEGMPPDIKKSIKMPKAMYQAKPSATCPKGTKGRIGIFEVLAMTKELEQIILSDNPSTPRIEAEAERQSMITMRQDGVLKALGGMIGMEELATVAQPVYNEEDVKEA